MKTAIINVIIVLLLGVLSPQLLRAQGTITYLSNLGQSSTGSNPVGSNSWIASIFNTGNNPGGYILNSIQLGMTDASGNPSGFTAMIYSAVIFTGFNPGSNLDTLTGSANPSTSGIYTYTDASNLILSPSTDYFIVLTAGTTVANGAYDWSLTIPNAYSPSDGWGAGGVWKSSNGSSWLFNSGAPQFAINATAIPEPSAISLILLGSGVLIYVRRTFQSNPAARKF